MASITPAAASVDATMSAGPRDDAMSIEPGPASEPNRKRKRSYAVASLVPVDRLMADESSAVQRVDDCRERTRSPLDAFYKDRRLKVKDPKLTAIQISQVAPDGNVTFSTAKKPVLVKKKGDQAITYTEFSNKRLPQQNIEFVLEPTDLILMKDLNDPQGRYLLAEIVEIDPNGDITVNMTDKDGMPIPYSIPKRSVSMDTIIPLRNDPKEQLQGYPTSQIPTKQFDDELDSTITAYDLSQVQRGSSSKRSSSS